MRIIAIAALAVLLCGSLTASAQRAPDTAGRFTIAPQDDGFLRLDTRSGAVSHCRKDSGGEWSCAPFNETDAVRNDAITALEGRIAVLAAELEALRADLTRIKREPGAVVPRPAPVVPQPQAERSTLPDEAELERALGFMEIVMRRFLTMVGEMKRQDAE